MNNIDKAAKLLVPNPTWCERVHKGEGGNPCMFCEADAEAGAVRLADAGLLAPDLPEPNEAGFWHTDNTVTRALPNLLVEAGFYGQGVDTYVKLTPAEAREAAHILLAAANYSEEGNRE